MSETVSDFLLRRLRDWGVSRIYGYPGDGIGGLVAAIGRSEAPEFVQVRHEEEAAFMACAHAKWTGETGVCMATSGPGAIHLLNGLYDARLDHMPVVAILGQQARAALGGSYQQEVDLESLFKDVASDFCTTCMVPTQARQLVDRAMTIAGTRRSVTALILPNDVQEAGAVPEPPHSHGTVHTGIGLARPRVIPADGDLQRAAEVLNAGERVAILAGAGALAAGEPLRRVADKLGAGVAKALLGKAVLPDDLPFVTGSIGLLGTEASDWMMRHCDTLLMVGSRFPYSEFLPKEGQARGVQIDLDPTMLSIRYPMEVPLAGDAAATLEALLPLLQTKEDSGWRRDIERQVVDWRGKAAETAAAPANPINPERVFREASDRLPDGALLAADSGSSANWFARALAIRPGMQATLSGTLATMCPAVPYATAAKFAFPDRVAVAFIGDGAMQMLGNAALITVAKYWREWSDPRLVVCVLNNGDLNQVTWELRAMSDSPRVPETQDVPAFDYAAYARMLGLDGLRVESPEDLGAAWETAFAASSPVVLDVLTDPDVPTLPPHVSFEQARSFARAMIGDNQAGGVLRQTIRRL